jgi:hypothetical protein
LDITAGGVDSNLTELKLLKKNNNMKTPEEVYNETEQRLEMQMATMDCFFTPYEVIYAAMKDYAKLYHEQQVKLLATPVVSKSLPTDEQLGEIVHKIAYTQQAEDQGDDFVNKVWMLKNFIEQHFDVVY